MAADDPLKTVQFALTFPTIPRAEATKTLELACDDEVIGSQRIVVAKMPVREAGGNDLKY